MENIDYMGALRRRWGVIFVAVVIGMAAGWFTKDLQSASGPPSYSAEAVLLGSSDSAVTNLSTLSLLTTVGQVPVLAANWMHYNGTPADLASHLRNGFDQDAGILRIGAVASSRQQAVKIANTFAHQLVQFLSNSRNSVAVATGNRLKEQMARLGQQIATLDSEIPGAAGVQQSLLQQERDAKIRAYGVLSDQYEQATLGSFQPASISVIQDASEAETDLLSGGAGKFSNAMRVLFGGVLGLLAGIALALALERFDRRLRTKTGAERSFGAPVLAEIPVLGRAERDGVSAGRLQPFQLLGALVGSGTSPDANEHGNGNGHVPSVPRTILVTSPSPSEGKTTVVANLAAALGDQGKNVVVLSSDLRRPRVHELFKVPDDEGLEKALTTRNGHVDLAAHLQTTSIPQVRVLTSAPAPDQAGALLSSEAMRELVDEAGRQADVVLLDSSSLLGDSDAATLTSMVDSVLVVADAGKTTDQVAKSTSEFLDRLGANVAGVALNRVEGSRAKPPGAPGRRGDRRKGFPLIVWHRRRH